MSCEEVLKGDLGSVILYGDTKRPEEAVGGGKN